MLILIIALGIIMLPVVYNVFFPLKKPDLSNYFKPGQTYSSKGEGITQTIIRQEDNKVYCELRFAPFAPGPPEHMHEQMPETIQVVQGTLSAKINGEVVQIHEGERVNLPAGVFHKIFNQTDKEVVLRPQLPEDHIPVEFAYSLDQLYPLMTSKNLTLKMFAKICVLDELFDSIPVGPPPAVFRFIKKAVKPYARLFGVKP